MTQRLGPLETRALAYCQSRERPVVAGGDLVRDLRWTAEQERDSQFQRNGAE